jgi:hypothetical protein
MFKLSSKIKDALYGNLSNHDLLKRAAGCLTTSNPHHPNCKNAGITVPESTLILFSSDRREALPKTAWKCRHRSYLADFLVTNYFRQTIGKKDFTPADLLNHW